MTNYITIFLISNNGYQPYVLEITNPEMTIAQLQQMLLPHQGSLYYSFTLREFVALQAERKLKEYYVAPIVFYLDTRQITTNNLSASDTAVANTSSSSNAPASSSNASANSSNASASSSKINNREINVLLNEQAMVDGYPGNIVALYMVKAFYPAHDNTYFTELLNNIPWQQEEVKFFGRTSKPLRFTRAYGDNGLSYKYAGKTQTPIAWQQAPALLLQIKRDVEALTQSHYNYVIINLYPANEGKKKSALGWHSDNEPGLVKNHPIASVSFGQARDFQVRSNTNVSTSLQGKGDSNTYTINLANGDLLVMAGAFQDYFKHQVPPRARAKEARINLTFRLMEIIN